MCKSVGRVLLRLIVVIGLTSFCWAGLNLWWLVLSSWGLVSFSHLLVLVFWATVSRIFELVCLNCGKPYIFWPQWFRRR